MTFYQGTNGRVAVLFPGRGYSPNHPLLYYARSVLLTQGWSVEEATWSAENLASQKSLLETITATLDKVADMDPLVVGKSLGSYALPLVAHRGWPAIWLTPLLLQSELVDALKDVKAKTLLVGGTADEWWDSDVAKKSGLQVLEMPGATHDLEIADDPVASAKLLAEFVETMTLFLESL